MMLIVVFYLKRITLMTLMVIHVLLFLKGNFNPSWMFKGHAILSPCYDPQTHMGGQGREKVVSYKAVRSANTAMYVRGLTKYTRYDSEISAGET